LSLEHGQVFDDPPPKRRPHSTTAITHVRDVVGEAT